MPAGRASQHAHTEGGSVKGGITSSEDRWFSLESVVDGDAACLIGLRITPVLTEALSRIEASIAGGTRMLSEGTR